MRSWLSSSVEETRAIGEALARELAPDGCLLLYADLGAGKTVLAQGMARGLGIDPARVQSPTYTLLNEHAGPAGTLRHFDLYRLSAGEVSAAGFEETLLGPGVKVVEWAERLPFRIPGALALSMRAAADGGREIQEVEQASGAGGAEGANGPDGSPQGD
jgi:tRNA threonylcarbamoyladenosine biosynthesis protein TsaE